MNSKNQQIIIEPEQIATLFSTINVWKRGDERAPHKPLLLLYALARCSRGESRLIPYAQVDIELTKLLKEFGPVRKSWHTEYPFFRLCNDAVWELYGADGLVKRKGQTDIKKSELLKNHVSGGLPASIYQTLRNSPQLLATLAQQILEQSFPQSIHEDILASLGLELDYSATKPRKRDPNFRARVLQIYEYRCAICGFDLRLGTTPLGLEAAHIKWHQAGGPDIETNGLALCAIHHKLFDRGAFTISLELKLIVSEAVNGLTGIKQWLLDYHGEYLHKPLSPHYLPEQRFLAWHYREVFRMPARHL